jgi:hypothetical protein
MLRSFCEEADHIAHVCLVAATDLPQTPGKRGWPALFWHDEFTALLLDIACKAGIAPTHGKDRITRKRTGWLVEAAKALETFLPRDMRSPDVETCGKRLERSLQNLGKIERQKFSPN